MQTDFTLRFRPDSLDKVIGQPAAVKSLTGALADGKARSFIFTGPSGCGKTTVARILAEMVGANDKNVFEIDAATNTGIDAMREVKSTLRYKPLGGGAKVLIVDECHMLSKSAWNSLLKDVEEPPPYGYWCFLTTEDSKIPKTIKTRCMSINLQSVGERDLFKLLESACKELDGGPDESILDVMVAAADGSPRQALNNLATAFDAESTKEAANILKSAATSSEVIEISRLLAKGVTKWSSYMTLLGALDSKNPEGIRLQITAYFTKVVMGSKTIEAAIPSLAVLDAFGKTYGSATGLGPVILSLGDLLND